MLPEMPIAVMQFHAEDGVPSVPYDRKQVLCFLLGHQVCSLFESKTVLVLLPSTAPLPQPQAAPLDQSTPGSEVLCWHAA